MFFHQSILAGALGIAGLSFLAALPATAQDVVTIGVAAPLTGPRANLGRYVKQGVEFAVEEINRRGGVLGKSLRVVFEDDQADNPNVAINAVNRLLKVHKVTAFVGPHFSVAQLATQKIYCGNAVSVTGATGVPVTHNCSTVIRSHANDNLQARALIEYALKHLKINKIGVLSINDDYGKAGAARVIAQIQDVGLTPVSVETHNREDKDFSAQLNRLRAAGADLIIMWTHENEAALIVRQARQLGMDVKFAGSASLSQPTFLKLTAGAGEGAISTSSFVPGNPDPAVQEFVKNYEAYTHTNDTELFAATYYDTVWLLAQAMERAGSTDPLKVRAAFDSLSYKGVVADYRCQSNGECNHQINIIEIQQGQPVLKTVVRF